MNKKNLKNRIELDIISDEKWNKVQKVIQYWFLLEGDLVRAIQKGRVILLGLARARVKFMKNVVDKNDLQKGLEGEEEAVNKIQRFLFNNGWWERPNNLNIRSTTIEYGVEREHKLAAAEDDPIHFINYNQHLVHPNVLNMVRNKDI